MDQWVAMATSNTRGQIQLGNGVQIYYSPKTDTGTMDIMKHVIDCSCEE